jgi:surface antigen
VHEDWRCDVAGTASVATQAGDFQTWRVDCEMRETPAVTGNGEVRRSLFYAPDIGFYVRMEERVGDGPTHETNLSGYTTSDPILSTSALRQRSIELQRALETQPSGTETTWSDATTGAAGKVTLLDTRSSEQYGWCRDFAERIRWTGRSYLLHGMGCRSPAKIWDIIMLAPGGAARE